jgi:hypothetical protein
MFWVARPAALRIDRFNKLFAIAASHRIADIDHQRLRGKRLAIIFADLLDRGIGHDEEYDIPEVYGLLHCTGFRQRSGAGDEFSQLLGVAGGKHDRVSRLSERGAQCGPFAAGANNANLKRRATGRGLGGYRLRRGARRHRRQHSEHRHASHNA